MRFELKQLNYNIFLLCFDNSYDLAMYFFRMTEFRESDLFPGCKNKMNLVDYMEKYAKDHANVFSYPDDWAGFNLPGDTIEKYPYIDIPDPNKYDKFMWNLFVFLSGAVGGYNFYVIGCLKGNEGVLNHEIAHAMYAQVSAYRSDVNDALHAMDHDQKFAIYNELKAMGYSVSVHIDEVQAYLATGLSDELQRTFRRKRISKKIAAPFQRAFKKYKKELKT